MCPKFIKPEAHTKTPQHVQSECKSGWVTIPSQKASPRLSWNSKLLWCTCVTTWFSPRDISFAQSKASCNERQHWKHLPGDLRSRAYSPSAELLPKPLVLPNIKREAGPTDCPGGPLLFTSWHLAPVYLCSQATLVGTVTTPLLPFHQSTLSTHWKDWCWSAVFLPALPSLALLCSLEIINWKL